MKTYHFSDASSGGRGFEASLEETRIHKAPYADVTSGVTFALHKPNEVLPRWRRQEVAAMHEAA